MTEGEESRDTSIRSLEDGVFDPENLLAQPINYSESYDLGLNMDESLADHQVLNRNDSTISEDERNREDYFRPPSPDPHAMMNDLNTEVPPHDYEPPPFKHNRRGKHPEERTPRRCNPHKGGKGNSERLADVQKKIQRIQQQIHENMNDDREMIENRHHSYRHGPDYSHHPDDEPVYYPEERYYNDDRRERFSPRGPPHDRRHPTRRSYSGGPSSMRGGDGGYDHPGHHRRQYRLQRHQTYPQRTPSPHRNGMYHHDHRGRGHGDDYEMPPPMHPMRRGPPPHDMPHHERSYRGGYRGAHGHVLGGMSQSLNAMDRRKTPLPPPNMRPPARAYHDHGGMQNMNDGNMPRLGIQSMSASLNGIQQMNSNYKNHLEGHKQQQLGIQSMSASLNGMQQSMNGAPMNRSMNGMNSMSASQNGMSTMKSMNRSMNGSMNGFRVTSTPLLEQVSNLASLANTPNQMGGHDMLSKSLMEAMKRTASSRKLIKDLNITAMLQGDLKSPTSMKTKSVVKAKRNAGRLSYTKAKSEATASREFLKSTNQVEAVAV